MIQLMCGDPRLVGRPASSAYHGIGRTIRHLARRSAMALGLALAAAQAPAAGSDELAGALRALEREAERVVGSGEAVGLAVAVVADGEIALLRGFGRVEARRGAPPVGERTVFRIASLSKTVAGTYAGLLVAEERLRWDTAVAALLPGFALADPAQTAQLTVTDLLAHRSGLPRHTFDLDLEGDQPYPLLIERLANTPLECPVGQCYGYQNVAFSLIGDIAFHLTGEFYFREVERRLFAPLGMEDASFGREALERSASWARPHVRRGRHWIAVRPKETYYRVQPAAGVNASAADLGRWMLAHLGHRPEVLDAGLLAAVHEPQIATERELSVAPWRRERLRSAHYARGWRVFDYAGERLLFHGGAVQGYRAMMGLLPGRDLGLALLWNCESPAPAGLFPNFLDRVLGLPRRDWIELPSASSRRRARG
ncbi:MAG: serine hydrolase domain-containing protein [Xanthomonadales bacterium]|nr:serine hydrolase domain-containing protein [Xanthomonadales bacterium]